jgi:uncharacterized protein (TIGR02271 family)
MTHHDVLSWRGNDVIDRDGDKLGTLEEIYLDQETGEPEWALINTGLFGTKSSFAPLQGASQDGGSVRIAYEKGQVKDAPSVDPDGALSHDEERQLYQHYGIGWEGARSDAGRFEGERTGGPGHDTSGPNTDNAMTRSEEELRVGTATEEAGRARLRKYVVTEEVQTTIPVQREELRVEREPITEGNVGAATDGPAISEEEHEVVLHEERPVVEKQVVPKERVRLDTETVAEERTVSDEVRKEQIDIDR